MIAVEFLSSTGKKVSADAKDFLVFLLQTRQLSTEVGAGRYGPEKAAKFTSNLFGLPSYVEK